MSRSSAEAQMLLRIAQALEKGNDATKRLATACENLNRNLVQIGQNLKEASDGSTSDD